ncbi:hypothetical protein AUJ46_01150 [Candidatus Peregrinibacteria bacterium CG1_02_54_53]|nr:MAG: hypothetical protein AUJ46_01150 [Candidatus Peregrinibacteria bacterium CG1_02_54_53]
MFRKIALILSVLLIATTCIVVGLNLIRNRIPVTTTIETDILIYGASLGGTSAAITAAEHGAKVVLATESETVGGQATEAGMSAFDDVRRNWEDNGIYGDLLLFLQKKRGGTGSNVGLGKAVVGRAASIPDDFEEFFRSRLQHENINLLTGQRLIEVRKKGGLWSEALLRDIQTHDVIRIRYHYLVDGTTTGKLLAMTETPFNLGIDAQSATEEISALHDKVRRGFIEGETNEKGQVIGGLGNRTQAMTSAFFLLDRGYPGEFFPPKEQQRCWKKAGSGSAIADASVLVSSDIPCPLEIPVTTESSDIFDVYLVHQGGSVRVFAASPLWQDLPLSFDLALPANEQYTRVGAFPIEAGRTVSFSLVAQHGTSTKIEGLILVKKNILHEQALVLRPPFIRSSIQWKGFPAYAAEALIMTRERLPVTLPKLTFRGHHLEMQQLSPFLARIQIPELRNGMTLTDLAVEQLEPSAIVIIPTKVSAGSQVFDLTRSSRVLTNEKWAYNSPFRNIKQPVHEWDFSVTEDALYLSSISDTISRWWAMELLDADSNTKIQSQVFSTQMENRLLQPLFLSSLAKGKKYKLRLASSNDRPWGNVQLIIDSVENSSTYFSDNASKALPTPAGIYDIWIRSAKQQALTIATQPSTTPTPLHHTIRRTKQYEYAGKAFLFPGVTIRASDIFAQMIAVPSPSVDVYRRNSNSLQPPLSSTFAALPPGLYRSAMFSHDAPCPSQATIREENGSINTTFAWTHVEGNDICILERPFIIRQDPIQFDTHTGSEQKESFLYLFEDIPPLSTTWTFDFFPPMTSEQNPLSVSLFTHRNIVSPANVLKGEPVGLIPSNIGKNTMGITLVVTPASDLKTVSVADIDSPKLIEQSRERAAAYAYWMRYAAAPLPEKYGCDPSHFTCTPKRMQLVIGLATDHYSPFFNQPYIREGRRLVSKKIVTQEDLRIDTKYCPDKKCPSDCFTGKNFPDWCVAKNQTAVLFEDALAAVQYQLDFHGIYTTEEYYASVLPLLEANRQLLNNFPSILEIASVFSLSKPAEVSLNMLLPANGANIFPASLNTGVSQIANSFYRTHVNEIAIGQAIGRVLSYCLATDQNPFALEGTPLRQLQLAMIREGTVLYPIDNISNDPLLLLGTQYLILTGSLIPRVHVPPLSVDRLNYSIDSNQALSASDDSIVTQLLEHHDGVLTYQALLPVAIGENLEGEALVAKSKQLGLLDDKLKNLSASNLLQTPVLKGDLYRAIGFRVKNNTLPPLDR